MSEATKLLRYLLPGGTTLAATLGYALTIRAFRMSLAGTDLDSLDGLSALAGAGVLGGTTILVGYLALNIYAFVLWWERSVRRPAVPWPFNWIDEPFLIATHQANINQLQIPIRPGRQVGFDLADGQAGAQDAILHIRTSRESLATTRERARGLLDTLNGLGATAAGLIVATAIGFVLFLVSDGCRRPDAIPFTIWFGTSGVFAFVFVVAQRRTCRVTTAYIDAMLWLTARR